MIDYGGSVSSRLQPFLKKRGTQGNMTKLTKLELVRRMVEARDYLETRRDLRPDHVRPIVDEIAAILARYKATDRLDHHRYAAARMITAVDIIRDPHAQRDQSSSGPQALREQAAVAQMARCVLAEAAALGVKSVLGLWRRREHPKFCFYPRKFAIAGSVLFGGGRLAT